MIAYLVLLLAVASRIVPHAWNVTAVGGSLLYFGARRPRWQAVLAMAALAVADVYLTCVVYGMSFHVQSYLVTWAWYAGVCLLGHALLGRRNSVLRTAIAVFTSATSFFLLSNFMVWAGSNMYARTPGGLLECYGIGLPFYGNDLVSTSLVAGVLFGVPALVRKLENTKASGSAAA